MSYHVMALIPPGVVVNLAVMESRLRELPGIGTVEASGPGELHVGFDGWEMWISHNSGDEIGEEIAEVVDIYGGDKPGLARVKGSQERVDISVPEPPDDPQGAWFDFCWETIEIVRGFGDIPVFDAMNTTFVFE